MVMVQQTTSGSISFVCSTCGAEEKGDANSALVLRATKSTTAGLFSGLIERAPYDRTNQLTKKDCPGCGLTYMTQVTIISANVIVKICSCGYRE